METAPRLKTGRTSELARIAARPDPQSWDDDELMSLAEAAALFWPAGPLTLASLRTAVRDGQLAVARIAGKFLTSKSAIRDMSACSIVAGRPVARPAASDFATGRVRQLRTGAA